MVYVVVLDCLVYFTTDYTWTYFFSHCNILRSLYAFYVFTQLGARSELSHIDRLSDSNALELKRLGIYFSRYGILHKFSVSEVVNFSTFPDFLEWFISRAQKYRLELAYQKLQRTQTIL
jgi:hypothetical protein